jgi:hypothetical protein
MAAEFFTPPNSTGEKCYVGRTKLNQEPTFLGLKA